MGLRWRRRIRNAPHKNRALFHRATSRRCCPPVRYIHQNYSCHSGLSVRRKEGLDYFPVACKLREQLLADARCCRRLALFMALLANRSSGNEERMKSATANLVYHRSMNKWIAT